MQRQELWMKLRFYLEFTIFQVLNAHINMFFISLWQAQRPEHPLNDTVCLLKNLGLAEHGQTHWRGYNCILWRDCVSSCVPDKFSFKSIWGVVRSDLHHEGSHRKMAYFDNYKTKNKLNKLKQKQFGLQHIFFNERCGFINNGMAFSAVSKSLFSTDWILTVCVYVIKPEPHLQHYQLRLFGKIAQELLISSGDLLPVYLMTSTSSTVCLFLSTLYLCDLNCLNLLLPPWRPSPPPPLSVSQPSAGSPAQGPEKYRIRIPKSIIAPFPHFIALTSF